MPRALHIFGLVLVTTAGLSCGGDGQRCNLNADCPGARACVDGRCVSTAPPDATDAGDADNGGLVTDDMRPRSVAVTGGGGHATTAAYQLTARIAAPTPMGETQSESYRLTAGPASLRRVDR